MVDIVKKELKAIELILKELISLPDKSQSRILDYVTNYLSSEVEEIEDDDEV